MANSEFLTNLFSQNIGSNLDEEFDTFKNTAETSILAILDNLEDSCQIFCVRIGNVNSFWKTSHRRVLLLRRLPLMGLTGHLPCLRAREYQQRHRCERSKRQISPRKSLSLGTWLVSFSIRDPSRGGDGKKMQEK